MNRVSAYNELIVCLIITSPEYLVKSLSYFDKGKKGEKSV